MEQEEIREAEDALHERKEGPYTDTWQNVQVCYAQKEGHRKGT